MRAIVLATWLAALTACTPTVPDSNPQGVGFGDYGQYIQGQQAASQPQTIAPPPVTAQPLGQAAVVGQTPPGGRPVAVPQTGNLGADVQAVLNATAPARAAPAAPSAATQAPVAAAPEAASPVVPLPERADDGRPNIVAYAINSKNPVGQQAFPRSNPFRDNASARACAKFASADRAQEAFLSAGGPERDGKSLDPDGDGFACDWDPTPFRQTGQ